MINRDLTADRAREVIIYDPSTGVMRWKTSRGGPAIAGEVAGRVKRCGYVFIGIDLRRYFAHRVAWLYVYGHWPLGQIDHVNGVKSDNRIDNLRDVPERINRENLRRARSDSTSGLLGVSWCPERQKFSAFIRAGGKNINLGRYESAEEAHSAYLTAKRLMHEGCTI